MATQIVWVAATQFVCDLFFDQKTCFLTKKFGLGASVPKIFGSSLTTFFLGRSDPKIFTVRCRRSANDVQQSDVLTVSFCNTASLLYFVLLLG